MVLLPYSLVTELVQYSYSLVNMHVASMHMLWLKQLDLYRELD